MAFGGESRVGLDAARIELRRLGRVGGGPIGFGRDVEATGICFAGGEVSRIELRLDLTVCDSVSSFGMQEALTGESMRCDLTFAGFGPGVGACSTIWPSGWKGARIGRGLASGTTRGDVEGLMGFSERGRCGDSLEEVFRRAGLSVTRVWSLRLCRRVG